MVDLITGKQTELLYKTLQAYSVRNEVIQNNIANVDTPNFKKSEVEFENILSKALRNNNSKNDIDIDDINPVIKVVDEYYAMRMDGNNVDIDAENVKLYVNATRSEAIANSIMTNSKIKTMAVTGR